MPVPYPGTSWYDQVREQGRLLTRDLTLYDGHHAVVRPLRMSTEQLVTGYHRLAEAFFRRRRVLRRLARNLQRRRNIHRPSVAVSFLALNHGYRRYHRRIVGG
jgi:hypothetical protein